MDSRHPTMNSNVRGIAGTIQEWVGGLMTATNTCRRKRATGPHQQSARPSASEKATAVMGILSRLSDQARGGRSGILYPLNTESELGSAVYNRAWFVGICPPRGYWGGDYAHGRALLHRLFKSRSDVNYAL